VIIVINEKIIFYKVV